MIRVEKLSKYYSGQRAIDDVTFEIKEGEIVGLLGLNGAGKSTILKILGCFLIPSAGKAYIDQRSVEDGADDIRKIIGFLPDSPPLYGEMIVEKFLRFVARIKGLRGAEVKSGVTDAIERANLQEVADNKISSLSHGFLQRVGIAQAIVHKPKVLILDEPINGLDPVQIVEMRDLILSLRGQHTVVLSSHILSEITKTCDRILIVDQGHLVAEGSEADLQSKMQQSFRLECEVERCSGELLNALKAIEGINHAAQVPASAHNKDVIEIDMGGDFRSEVARVIVNSGTGLLTMKSKGEGLEGLFMNFVKS